MFEDLPGLAALPAQALEVLPAEAAVPPAGLVPKLEPDHMTQLPHRDGGPVPSLAAATDAATTRLAQTATRATDGSNAEVPSGRDAGGAVQQQLGALASRKRALRSTLSAAQAVSDRCCRSAVCSAIFAPWIHWLGHIP